MDSRYKDLLIYHPNPLGEEGAGIRENVARGRSSLRYFLGDDVRRGRLFKEFVNDDRIVTIVSAGKPIGYAAFFLEGRGPLSPPLSQFLSEYGVIKGIGNFLLFKITEPRVRASALYIYNINVAPEHRGKGAGGALIDAVTTFAASAGCTSVTLQVAAHNRAMILYLKKGFRVTGAMRAGWSRRFFPFDCLVTMELRINPSHAVTREVAFANVAEAM